MADWFRQTKWDAAAAATFEARVRRARRKAGYLNIQGYTLMRSDPHAAAELFRRAIALDDPAETARAGLYLGTALALCGDLDGAIEALAAAIAAEERHPMHKTAARLDMALLIALARRYDLYDLALAGLGHEQTAPFEDQELSALIARALIKGERGEPAGPLAAAALATLETIDGAGDLPDYISLEALKLRLRAILTPEPQ